MEKQKEIRFLAYDVEVRAGNGENENKDKYLEGYVVKWEQLSQKLGWLYKFREKFKKGAFADSLNKDNQRALWNHNTDLVLGNTKPKTLELNEDDIGLRFSIKLPNNSWGNDCYESVDRGDVDGVSFGFKMEIEKWDESDPDDVIRTIEKAKLFEISPTAFPAYEGISEVDTRNNTNIYDPYKEYKDKKESENKRNINDFTEIRKKLMEV